MAITAIGVTKHFRGRRHAAALNDVSLRIDRGEMVALLGCSGSGKSTLIRHIAGLELSDRGTGDIRIENERVQHHGRLNGGIRRTRAGVGVIFQQFNLVGRLDLLTNVLTGSLHRLPAWRTWNRSFPANERQRALAALDRVGILEQAWQRASTLSGGQQQRAAIARALVQGAHTILADEPVASLDPESARRVMEILASVNREDGVTVVVSLHQVDFAMAYCPRTIALREGRVLYDGPTDGLDAGLITRIYGGDAAVGSLTSRRSRPTIGATATTDAIPEPSAMPLIVGLA